MTGLSAVPPQWDLGQIDLLLTLTDIIVGSWLLNNKWVAIKIWCLQGPQSSLSCVYCSDRIVLLAIQLIIILIIFRVTRLLQPGHLFFPDGPEFMVWVWWSGIYWWPGMNYSSCSQLLLLTPNLCTTHPPMCSRSTTPPTKYYDTLINDFLYTIEYIRIFGLQSLSGYRERLRFLGLIWTKSSIRIFNLTQLEWTTRNWNEENNLFLKCWVSYQELFYNRSQKKFWYG